MAAQSSLGLPDQIDQITGELLARERLWAILILSFSGEFAMIDMMDLDFRLSELKVDNERVLRALRRQNRALRVLATLLAIGAVVAMLMASVGPTAKVDKDFDTVRAKKIVVLDQNGRERIRLDTGTDPQAKVVLLDSAGSETAGLYLWSDSAMFYATRYGGPDASAYMYAGKDNATFMGTSGAGGGGNAPLVLSSVGDTQTVYLGSRKGGQRGLLSVSDELPKLSLFDTKGAKVRLGIEKDGKPIVRLQEEPIKGLEAASSANEPQFEIVSGKLQKKKKG